MRVQAGEAYGQITWGHAFSSVGGGQPHGFGFGGGSGGTGVPGGGVTWTVCTVWPCRSLAVRELTDVTAFSLAAKKRTRLWRRPR